MTLLGKIREKRRVREGESKWDGCCRKGTADEKGVPHPGKSPTGGKIKQIGEISRGREECSSNLDYGKADQELNGPSELRAESPKIETPGWGLGTETSAPEVSPRERAGGGGAERKLIGRSRNHLTGQRLPGRLENKAVAEEGSNTPGAGKWKASSEGTWEKSLVCAHAWEGREEGVGPHRIPPTPQQAHRPVT